MTLLVQRLEVDQDELNQLVPELAMRLSRDQASSGTWITLVHPRSDAEQRYRRYVGRITLKLNTGQVGQGRGQILATRHRVLGMLTSGDFNGQSLDEATGQIIAFSVNLSELAAFHAEGNKLTGTKLGTFTGDPNDPFELALRAPISRLTNSGMGAKAQLAEFFKLLTPEGGAVFDGEVQSRP